MVLVVTGCAHVYCSGKRSYSIVPLDESTLSPKAPSMKRISDLTQVRRVYETNSWLKAWLLTHFDWGLITTYQPRPQTVRYVLGRLRS